MAHGPHPASLFFQTTSFAPASAWTIFSPPLSNFSKEVVHSVATSSPPFLLRLSPAWLPPHSSTEITSVIGNLCPAQSHVCPHLSAFQPSFLKHFFFWLPRCHPLLVPSYLSGLLSVSFAASSIFTSHSLASWGFSRGHSSLENFCLIMEVRSHRTPFRSFPPHSGQIMKACLRSGPSTCLSLPRPPSPACTLLQPHGSSAAPRADQARFCSGPMHLPLFAPAPLALCMAGFGRTGILSVQRPSPPLLVPIPVPS